MKFAGNPSLSDSQTAEARWVDRVDAERAVREVEVRLRIEERTDSVGIAVQCSLVDDLPEAERDDGEVVPPKSKRRQADEHAGDGGDDRGDEDDEPDRDVDPADSGLDADRAELEVDRVEVRRGEPCRRVGADRVEGDIAEIEQTRVADDHVQPDRHHREDDDRDHRVHVREGLEDGNLEQHVGSVELVRPQDRVGEGNPQHGQRQSDPPSTPRQQVEGVHDREESEQRRVRRHPRRPRDHEHERSDHERRDGPLQERRLRLPA